MNEMRLKTSIFFLLSLFASNLMAAELVIPDDKAVIQFKTKLGDVTFAHAMHSSLSITECATCHHKMQPEDTAVKPCHDCHQHKSDENAPKTKKAFHTRCTGCHEYTVAGGHHAGPVKKKCRLCHVKPAKK
jgi:class III cytochrome C family protein